MCGITGWIDWTKNLTLQKTVLEAMTAALRFRGPDAEGYYITPRAALGHRRLTVVDPVGGTQPMTRHRGDSQFTIIYNGELYNTEDLRKELIARGHSFRSHSDTEVLLTSYMEWGPECVERLNGIFAFAIWSEPQQQLFLARDRLGVKPLFYMEQIGSFLFGSELKALLAHPSVEATIDAEGLAEVFALGPSRTPGHGVYRGIKELRPGCCMMVDVHGTRIRQYWKLESRPHEEDLDATVSKLRELLIDSIERQLVSDVPIGTLLSGGLDSSVITAVAALAFQRDGLGKLDTYSIDYVDNDLHFRAHEFQPNSDAPWIKRVAEHFGTKHHSVYVDTPELVEALTTAVAARDLPGQVDVDSSLYLFASEIKKETTVVLSGECADELFGGYPWFHREDAMNSNTFPWLRKTRERASLLKPELVHYIQPEDYVTRRYEETLAEVPRLPGENPLDARRREMFYLNICWFMAQLLDRKDRMTMAAGLEGRVPYCDHRLVEYVWNIPWEMKSCDGREKGIIRRAMRGILPEDVLYRRKSPYPKTHNPAYTRAVRNWLSEILEDPASPLLQLIDEGAVRSLLQADADTTHLPWYGQLMSVPQMYAYLAQVNYWLKEYRVRIV
ncbi:asparagine synthase (glutamine-hydrolyzing) [Effusibacillus lacus]|uniref:asparagine synthase (glutamine-hydrolyzing) n=1 Tax=Effusibacillus lacus TaxID=1348429 RepID=A0A292YD93_9BACL|nr:asparagine synthase (glutamine-hydrolyzing) [Effusibacillus lacus]TCS71392.1 asparagine synthase (glutamine-hydrolysing) [Effusibacillus lacus]GAX89922.1 asparagine synthetase B [Effusibacillus lacus]